VNFWKKIELEWKVLMLAATFFIAFVWPVQRFFIQRLSETLVQSMDPDLELTLRAELGESSGLRREALKEHIERYRQTRALLPIIVKEQQRLIIALFVGLFALLSLCSLWILKRLTRPLKNLAAAVDQIGKGRHVEIRRVSGGALGVAEQAVSDLQNELVILREKAHIQGMESAWKDIARVMAHEIKNPLTPIRLTLDRIEERTAGERRISAEELSKFLLRINGQLDMLERLVNQFRSFSREPEVNVSALDLAAQIKSAGDGVSDLETTIEGSAQIVSDPYLLQQIALNLWKNAFEAGATRIHVSITGHDPVRVEITDNGPGIDAEKIRKVWLPYITFNKKNGTGLGLPVVKRLVETLGGTVDLVSPAGSGVCVIMELPAKIPQKEVE